MKSFLELFGGKKPIIAMLHMKREKRGKNRGPLARAKEEIELFYKNGINAVLVENYFGSVSDCEDALRYLQQNHSDKVYGINVLGDYRRAFAFADQYGAKFIQIDSVCGHLEENADLVYGSELKWLRSRSDAFVLGGVRFKYQPIRSGRSLEEDLHIGMARCDAIVVTGDGTGMETPREKLEAFQNHVKDFPLIIGAGVTLENIEEALAFTDGLIVGSWLKEGHDAHNNVSENHVRALREKADAIERNKGHEVNSNMLV